MKLISFERAIESRRYPSRSEDFAVTFIGWQDKDRPADSTRWLKIFRLRLGQECWVQILEDPIGVPLHWVEGRSQPHLEGQCPYCPKPVRLVWYAPAIVPQQRFDREAGRMGWDYRRWVLELMDSNMETLEGRECRGLVARLFRGKQQYAPLILHVSEKQPADEPPASFNVKPVLCRLWGWPQLAAYALGNESPEVIKFRRAE